MFVARVRQHLALYRYVKFHAKTIQNCPRLFHIYSRRYCQEEKRSDEKEKQLVVLGSFENIENKNKDTYLDMIRIFVNKDHVHRRGHVEFIYAALKNMEDFGVHKDLEVYKSLINVLPKGKFIATNMFQVEFMHYPKQQQCMIDLLEQMEDNGVMPDYEIEDILTNIFGNRAYPLRKFWRMMYWMPKFKNLSPWPLPDQMPSDSYELAKLAIERITTVDLQSQVTIYQSKDIADSIDDTWIVSGQSPIQKRLMSEHRKDEPVYVEGAFRIWLRKYPVNYFILRTNPKPVPELSDDSDNITNIKVPLFNFNLFSSVKKKVQVVPSVHEQEDGVILAVCATGTSSKDSLLSWIRHLEQDGNPNLADVPVVFTLKSGPREVAVVEDVKKIDEK